MDVTQEFRKELTQPLICHKFQVAPFPSHIHVFIQIIIVGVSFSGRLWLKSYNRKQAPTTSVFASSVDTSVWNNWTDRWYHCSTKPSDSISERNKPGFRIIVRWRSIAGSLRSFERKIARLRFYLIVAPVTRHWDPRTDISSGNTGQWKAWKFIASSSESQSFVTSGIYGIPKRGTTEKERLKTDKSFPACPAVFILLLGET